MRFYQRYPRPSLALSSEIRCKHIGNKQRFTSFSSRPRIATPRYTAVRRERPVCIWDVSIRTVGIITHCPTIKYRPPFSVDNMCSVCRIYTKSGGKTHCYNVMCRLDCQTPTWSLWTHAERFESSGSCM